MITYILLAALVLAIALTYVIWQKMQQRVAASNDRDTIRMLWADLRRQENTSLKIVEADKILESALARLGYGGTFDEKLQAVSQKLSHIDALRKAHDVSLSLEKDNGMTVNIGDAESAIAEFERALNELGVA